MQQPPILNWSKYPGDEGETGENVKRKSSSSLFSTRGACARREKLLSSFALHRGQTAALPRRKERKPERADFPAGLPLLQITTRIRVFQRTSTYVHTYVCVCVCGRKARAINPPSPESRHFCGPAAIHLSPCRKFESTIESTLSALGILLSLYVSLFSLASFVIATKLCPRAGLCPF